MNVFRVRLLSPLLAMLALTVATSLPRSLSRAQDKDTAFEELRLSYDEFDQRPGEGWRKLGEQGKFLEAARLIDRYESEKQELEQWQRVNLRFHAGQMYAFADQKDQALARFKTALHPHQSNGPHLSWNTYVQATIAFLQRDRQKLLKLRQELVKEPGILERNVAVVDRLIQNFDEPYATAYSGSKPKE